MPTKSAFASVTVIATLVSILASGATLLGYTISADDQAAMVTLIQSGMMVVTTIVSIVSGVVAIWGRIRATKQVTLTGAPKAPLQ